MLWPKCSGQNALAKMLWPKCSGQNALASVRALASTCAAVVLMISRLSGLYIPEFGGFW
jgi:hypothetical protein